MTDRDLALLSIGLVNAHLLLVGTLVALGDLVAIGEEAAAIKLLGSIDWREARRG